MPALPWALMWLPVADELNWKYSTAPPDGVITIPPEACFTFASTAVMSTALPPVSCTLTVNVVLHG